MAEFRFFLTGEIDVASVGQLHSDLDAAIATHPGTLVLECSELTFIDAAGINTLIDAHRRLEAAGRGLRIEHLRPLYRHIFERLELVQHGRASSPGPARHHPPRRHPRAPHTDPTRGAPGPPADRRVMTQPAPH